MENVLILAAVAGVVAGLLALWLWIMLHSQVVMPQESLSLMAVAGSGGHTTGILRLLGHWSSACCPRHYIIAETDEMSAQKISSFELNWADRDPVLAVHSAHHLVCLVVLLSSDLPSEARFGTYDCHSYGPFTSNRMDCFLKHL